MENLPNETLIKIFGYLRESDDLERASAVCRRWSEVIRNSSEILDSVWRCVLRMIFDSEAPIFFLPYKNLEIWSSTFTIWLPLSNKFSSLKQLSILETSIEFAEFETCTQLEMPYLEYLALDTGSEMFLSIIFCKNVRHFDYVYEYGTTSSFKRALRLFFASNRNLKRLCFHKGFPKINLSIYKFKLEHLEIDDTYDLPSHFIDFLKTQQSSLKELMLKVENVEEPVLNYIYFEMHLTKLIDNHGSGILWQLERKVNQSIKNLSIKYGLTSRDASIIKQITSRCEALEFLQMELNPYRPKETLRWLKGLMPRLKTVALSLKRTKNLKVISKWIKSNGYHASLSFVGGWLKVPESIAKDGLEEVHECTIKEGMVLFISSVPGSSLLQQFGKVVNIDAFFQISQNYRDNYVNMKNLNLYKQDKRMKKGLQIRIRIEHIVMCCHDEIGYLEFITNWDDFWEDSLID